MTGFSVIDPQVLHGTFPEPPQPEIRRDNILDTLDRIFEAGTHVVSVEGIEGIGKTTLLAQFALRHLQHCLVLFIRPTSRLAYAPEYLSEILSMQLHRILEKKHALPERVEASFLATRIPVLQRRALREKQYYYFIIDGLADIPHTKDIPSRLTWCWRRLYHRLRA
jgi:hypothetical protein